jgi:hypothetical protein
MERIFKKNMNAVYQRETLKSPTNHIKISPFPIKIFGLYDDFPSYNSRRFSWYKHKQNERSRGSARSNEIPRESDSRAAKSSGCMVLCVCVRNLHLRIEIVNRDWAGT